MNKLIDSNLIIRYFVNDDPQKSSAVEKLLKNTKISFILTDIVVSEIVWTLSSYYRLEKIEIVDKIQALLNLENIKADKNLLRAALSFYNSFNIDFIDAYLAAVAQEKKIKEICSFDKHFDKIKHIKRYIP